MSAAGDGITVVVMTFNEAASLTGVVEELHTALRRLGREFEILIVDDGSRDGTAAIAAGLQGSMTGIRVVTHEHNAGLGSVYWTGFRQARCPLVTFFPADGQFPATIIEQFARAIENHDAVFGTLDNPVGFVGAALNRAERLLYLLLFGPVPRFQGIVMFRRRLLDEIPLQSPGGRGWAVLMELILKISRGPYRIANARTTLRPRRSGASKVRNPRTIWVNLAQAVRLRRLL